MLDQVITTADSPNKKEARDIRLIQCAKDGKGARLGTGKGNPAFFKEVTRRQRPDLNNNHLGRYVQGRDGKSKRHCRRLYSFDGGIEMDRQFSSFGPIQGIAL